MRRCRLRTIWRASASACSSEAAKWSATSSGACARRRRRAPPRSRPVLVAAFTSGGPLMKIVPVPCTITVSSLIAGTYAPPAVHEPITTAICGIPFADMRAWLEDPPEVVAVGEDLGLEREEGAARVDEVDAPRWFCSATSPRAQVLLHRERK